MKFANNPKIDRESLRALPMDLPQKPLLVSNNQAKVGNGLRELPSEMLDTVIKINNNPKIDAVALQMLPNIDTNSRAIKDEPKTGYIYIGDNPSFVGMFKVGASMNPPNRIQQFNTSDPYRAHILLFSICVDEYLTVERLIKVRLAPYRVSVDPRHEWFKCPFENIQNIVQDIAANYYLR